MDTPIVAEIDPPHRTQTRPRSAKIKNMGGPVTSNLDVCMLCDQSKYKLKKTIEFFIITYDILLLKISIEYLHTQGVIYI